MNDLMEDYISVAAMDQKNCLSYFIAIFFAWVESKQGNQRTQYTLSSGSANQDAQRGWGFVACPKNFNCSEYCYTIWKKY